MSHKLFIGALDLSAYPVSIVREQFPTILRFNSLPAPLIEDLRESSFPRPSIYLETRWARLVFNPTLADKREQGRFLVLEYYKGVAYPEIKLFIWQRSSRHD